MATFTAGQVLTAAELGLIVDGSGWINVSGGVGFTNSWTTSGGDTVSYRLVGNICYLRGQISSGTGGAAAFTLPAGYRPAQHSAFFVADQTSGGGAKVVVGSDGTVKPSPSTDAIQLDGISFFVN